MATYYWINGTGIYTNPSSWSTSSGGISNATTDTATVTSITNVLLGTAALTPSTTPTLGNRNDGYWKLTPPWSTTFLGRTYPDIYVNTNGIISFGTGTISATTPTAAALPSIGITAKDNAALRLYYGTEGTAPNRTYRVRYEGTDTAAIYTSGDPFIVWEAAFYEATATQIDVQVGVNANGLSSVGTGNFGVSGNFSRGTTASISAPQVSPGRQAQLSTITYNSNGTFSVPILTGGIGYTSAFLTITTASAVNNIIADATTASYTLTNVSSTSGIYLNMLAVSDWYMPVNSFVTNITTDTITLNNLQIDSTASNTYSFIDPGLSQTIPVFLNSPQSGVYGVYNSSTLLSSFPGIGQNVQNQGFKIFTNATATTAYNLIPTLTDSIIFDTNSSSTSYTVYSNGNSTLSANTVTVAGPPTGSVTIGIGAASNWSIYGNFTLASTGVIWNSPAVTLNFFNSVGSKTFTTNGVTLNSNIGIQTIG